MGQVRAAETLRERTGRFDNFIVASDTVNKYGYGREFYFFFSTLIREYLRFQWEIAGIS